MTRLQIYKELRKFAKIIKEKVDFFVFGRTNYQFLFVLGIFRWSK